MGGRVWGVVARVALVCAAWAAVVAVEVGGVWVARVVMASEAGLVRGAAYLTAAIVTAMVVAGEWAPRRPKRTVAGLAVAAVVAAAVVAVDWTAASVRGYYRVHRADFAAVVAVAAGGGLIPDSYYGELLPPELRHLSIKGSVARIGGSGLLLPARTTTPDGVGGFAFLGDAPPAGTYDCYGSQFRTRWSLGDGWYWLQDTMIPSTT
ncbi:hypothetical protein [Catenuloplanes atrovinosus]|uniref:Energy-converting hydrogenase Eha subunit A n=1 Tax=Catenuloplanes atrovinosus TaxID=137266 RepID=A0AAE3YPT2_9ACTN|nr:hypothetical protein [Catenuloplanes atrovinosus]MDR7277012.1 energy-converting hydrogenase Eha subunit A [Catenuloplanes atrovinosus]